MDIYEIKQRYDEKVAEQNALIAELRADIRELDSLVTALKVERQLFSQDHEFPMQEVTPYLRAV